MVRGYVPCDIPAYSPTPSAASSAIGTPATANPDARETHGRNSDSFVHVDRAEPGPPDATGENANGTQQTEPASKPLSSTVIHKSSELFKWISPYLAHASVWIIIFLLPLHILKSSYCSITTGCGGAISRGHERRIDVSVAPVVSRWGDSEGSRAVHQIRVQVETAEEVFKSVFDFGNRVEHQITVDWPHIQLWTLAEELFFSGVDEKERIAQEVSQLASIIRSIHDSTNSIIPRAAVAFPFLLRDFEQAHAIFQSVLSLDTTAPPRQLHSLRRISSVKTPPETLAANATRRITDEVNRILSSTKVAYAPNSFENALGQVGSVIASLQRAQVPARRVLDDPWESRRNSRIREISTRDLKLCEDGIKQYHIEAHREMDAGSSATDEMRSLSQAIERFRSVGEQAVKLADITRSG